MRALTTHLATGRGAIYHHVATMDELLAAATDRIIADAVTRDAVAGDVGGDEPRATIRARALGIFDAIDTHPWVGIQLSREPMQPAVFRIWSSIGSSLQNLGMDGSALSDAGAALVNYILGSAAQFGAGARRASHDLERTHYLQALASAWARSDDDPMVQQAASELPHHDDREQFLAGVDIFLAGIAPTAPQSAP